MYFKFSNLVGAATAGAAVFVAAIFGAPTGRADDQPLKLTLFGQPSVNNDSIWMALEKGLYKAGGLDVTYRLFPSGNYRISGFPNWPRRYRPNRRFAERAVFFSGQR
jgi:hypothetical protein